MSICIGVIEIAFSAMASEVGAGLQFADLVGELDPVIGDSALVDSPDGPERSRQAAALGRDPRAAHGVRRTVGKVDVDEAARLPVAGQQLSQDLAARTRRAVGQCASPPILNTWLSAIERTPSSAPSIAAAAVPE